MALPSAPSPITRQFRDLLLAEGANGWAVIGRMLEEPGMLDACRGARLDLMADSSRHHRAAAIVPLGEAMAEREMYRLQDPALMPELFTGMSNGPGRKAHADPALFYRTPPLTVRFVTYGAKDNGHDLFTADGRLLVRDSSWLSMLSPSRLNPYLDPQHRFGLFMVPNERLVIQDPCLLIGGQLNHYHFLIDHLAALILAQDIEGVAGLPVVFHRLPPVQRELCRLFGLDPGRFIQLDHHAQEPVIAAAMTAPVVPGRIPLPVCVQALRRRLGLASARARGRRRLFIGRRAAAGIAARLVDQELVGGALEPLGFEMVFPEDHTAAEQRAMFGEAEIVVCAHGAALANLVFAPPTAIVVEIMGDLCHADPLDRFGCYRKLAAAIGQPYYRLVCPTLAPLPGQAAQDRPFVCLPARLTALVAAAVDSGF
ncbi:glycosyltransferase family 61 protein (plasmid) [Azospirillum sp. TSA2s]|uniref:glycosyltransferase family 61 protein n=1 Tax=Azospirillum sp. TSA2s TaxID=709810 RepID=UPI0010AABF7D|nr:glycosyltransferase 61 family protein [Azospirillum sp. TSA2s]QCG93056.1 glycosyltransferase family 61 protein [Azospirillum sp. TSA2s]